MPNALGIRRRLQAHPPEGTPTTRRAHRTRLEWIKLFIVSFARARRFMNPLHQTAVVTVGDTVEWVRCTFRPVAPARTRSRPRCLGGRAPRPQVQHFTNDPAVLDRRLTGVQALPSPPRAFGAAPSRR